MSDIVDRLREDARGGMAYHELSDEAADEIERLRLENKELRETGLCPNCGILPKTQ